MLTLTFASSTLTFLMLLVSTKVRRVFGSVRVASAVWIFARSMRYVAQRSAAVYSDGQITRSAERAWYLKVAREAHRRGLSVGMKNGVEVLDERLVKAFDWSLNEECFFYDECGREMPFIRAGKAVFQTEYTDDWRRRGRTTPASVHRRVCA